MVGSPGWPSSLCLPRAEISGTPCLIVLEDYKSVHSSVVCSRVGSDLVLRAGSLVAAAVVVVLICRISDLFGLVSDEDGICLAALILPAS